MTGGLIRGVACGLAAAACAVPPANANVDFRSADASSRPRAAHLAADGKISTSWAAAHAGRWTWTGRLRSRRQLTSVRIRSVGAAQLAKVSFSADGRQFSRTRAVTLRRGRWTVVAAGGRAVAAVRITSGSSRRRGHIAEVQAREKVVNPPDPQDDEPQDGPQQDPPTADDPQENGTPVDAGPGGKPRKADPAPSDPTGPAPAPAAASGAFAGIVGTPIDPAQLKGMPFGARSHWLQPWRAYLDTVPAARLRDAVGINFNVSAADAAPVARLLAASGFKHARVEIAWGDLSYTDPSALRDPTTARARLRALRDSGLRPLVLLNSDAGRPGPARDDTLTVTGLAFPGARQVQLDTASAAKVVPGKTGINGAYGAEYLITSMSGTTATLSKPVPALVWPGSYPSMTLRYEPFAPLRKPDGAPNPAGEATLQGWLDYVNAVTTFVKAELGSSQFDVEVSNEANLNAAYYDINQYYEPDPFPARLDDQVIADRTVAWVKDPAHDLPGARVTNGFASQRPWDSGATSPAGLDALSKHYYPRNLRFPTNALAGNEPRDALGNTSGLRLLTGWQDTFAPTYDSFFPEDSLTGIATETMLRDLAPWTESWRDLSGRTSPHGRTVAAPDGKVPEIWMTEMGLETGYAASRLGQTMSVEDHQRMRAKATLRTLTAYVNKGVTQVDMFSAGMAEWTLIGYDFWAALQNNPGVYPGDAAGGPVMDGVRRLVAAAGSSDVTVPRRLQLASIGDYAGGVEFAGDGTAAHPSLMHRDMLAFLPFQASDHRFVVPVYVMTRNLAKVRRPNLPASDPARYDLPAERYQLTIGGTNASRAKVSAVDPLTGGSVNVDVVRRTDTGWLVVEMPVTDSPRLLIIDDAP